MRLKINFFLVLILLATSLRASFVSLQDARSTARAFLVYSAGSYTHTVNDNPAPVIMDEDGTALIYIIQLSPEGFMLISADDASYPLLAYSFESNYTENNLPDNYAAWIKGYSDQIEYGIENNIQADTKTSVAWDSFLNGSIPASSKSPATSVAPLLTTTWDQGAPYNYLCPEAAGGSGGHVWAGCVATAMSQVANYWRWPLQGTGSHGYYSSYGYLSADYGSTFYKWEEMTNSASGQNFQMAQLQLHMGIAVDMMYSPNGSGAYSDDAADALRNYFGMDQGLHLEDAPSPINESWKTLLRSELDAGRPLYYHGFGTGGHAFNLDGYEGNDYFHFNWGWSGSFNGYFYLENLNPGGNSFTEGQGAIVGIMPTGNYPYYCNSTDTLRNIHGTIEDGSGPVGQYLGNTNCGWLIIPEDSILNIKLTFHRFDLEYNNDFLTIYDGADTTAPVLGIYTGSDAPQQTVSTGGKMFLKFTTNGTGNSGGWFASYSATRATFCSGLTTLTAPSGSISDGSGTFNYHENSLCKYKIIPDSAQSITISFDEFDTFDENDFLMIFNLEDNELLYKLYGSQNPGTLYFNTSKLLLMFRSNSSDNAQGWSLNYFSSPYTGISEQLDHTSLEFFPNPANQTLCVKARRFDESQINLELFTIQGKQVYDHQVDCRNGILDETIDISMLRNGIYLLRLSAPGTTLNRRIVISH